MEQARRSRTGQIVECPRCGAKVALSAGGIGWCAPCQGSLVDEPGGPLVVEALAARVQAVEVSRVLAQRLRARKVPRPDRLLAIQHRELPYWEDAEGRLEAAFSTAIHAARELEPAPGPRAPAALAAAPDRAAGCLERTPRALVIVPAFEVLYEVRGRRFHALVDASRGEVLGDLFPHRFTRRVHLMMALVLLLDVGAFAAVGRLAPNNLVRVLAISTLTALVYAFNAAIFRLRERWP